MKGTPEASLRYRCVAVFIRRRTLLRIDRHLGDLGWDTDGFVVFQKDRPDEDAFGLAGGERRDGNGDGVAVAEGDVGPDVGV